MKTFSYTLKTISPTEAIGPSIYLPVDSITGIPLQNGRFAAKAAIPSLDVVPSEFDPQPMDEVSFMDAYLGGGTGSAFHRMQATMSAGFDTGLGFKLAMQKDDINNFSNLLVLLREANAQDSQNVQIVDISGSLHTLTVGELRPLLVQYGFYYNQAWASSKA